MLNIYFTEGYINRPGSVDDNMDPLSFHMERMKSEQNRLNSYRKWSPFKQQRPSELSKSGLFYTNIDDRVQCPFCHGVLKNWLPSDAPYFEHSKHFPHCQFVRGVDVGNIPISSPTTVPLYDTKTEHYQRSSAAVNIMPPYATNTVIQPERYRSIHSSQSGYSNNSVDLTMEKNRLNTFSIWPPYLSQSSSELARAGFYHIPSEGRPDRVKCAYCKGKLFGWKSNDDPWFEHWRCFPHCPYIKLCLGDMSPNENCIPCSVQDEERPSTFPPPPEEQDKSNMLKIRMKGEPVVTVLQMGFPVNVVRSTVKQCLDDRLGNFPSAEELVSMVMEQEDPEQAPITTVTPQLSQLQTTAAAACSDNAVTSRKDNRTLGSDRFGNTKGLQNGKTVMSRRFLCKVCMKGDVKVAFLPCGHLACCFHCSLAVNQCPVCYKRIIKCVKTYF